ncbi:glycosyltransferase family 2 protein [Apiospora marii]|uniref:Glycosyltransferase family 2 protein n=1 Tax=Apiospora marii TaxID=335849 RepID=A0ABR1SQ35_9PEZI
MTSVIAPTVLAAFWAWGRIDKLISLDALECYRSARVLENPTYKTSDISVVVPTKDTPAMFKDCLRLWALNKPKEIIISTVYDQAEAIRQLIAEDETLAQIREKYDVVIKVVYVPEGGRRVQLVKGYQHATGRLIATVDDSIQWPANYLRDMAACFEDPTVGAAGPMIDLYVPEDRRNAESLSPWDVLAMRMAYNRNPTQKIPYAKSRWCFILAGTTCLIRPEIVQDPTYVDAFLNDFWRGQHRLDVGDDTFTSRWLQRHGWTIAIQDTPSTTVLRTSRVETRAYFRQIMRWERSSVQHFLRTLMEVPQIWQDGYVARKTLERVFRPVLSTVHIAAWVVTALYWPRFALFLGGYYVLESLSSFEAFFRKYPYMLKYWYAAVAADYIYILQDYWAWATLNNTSWEARTLAPLEVTTKGDHDETDGSAE